jgi:hypothetical protein
MQHVGIKSNFARKRCFQKFSIRFKEGVKQGDQIGRILAYWVVVYFGQFLEDYMRRSNFCPTFSTVQMCKVCQNMDWARFWAIHKP